MLRSPMLEIAGMHILGCCLAGRGPAQDCIGQMQSGEPQLEFPTCSWPIPWCARSACSWFNVI